MLDCERQLMWALQALAQPATMQLKLFPSFVVVADELALEFEHWQEVAIQQVGKAWSSKQQQAMKALDQMLTEMSASPELWESDDCLEQPQWAAVRQLAQDVLVTFNWPIDLPPLDRTTYVKSSNPG